MDLDGLWRVLHEAEWPPTLEPVFWTALLLVAGALAGELIARTTRWPRVVGYSLAGAAAAAVGAGAAIPLHGGARLIIDLALALLLFEIGARVRLRWLRFNPALLLSSMAEAAGSACAVYFALRWIELAPDVAAACAVLVIPASAVIAGRVSLELGAEGQVTDRMIMLTALNTLYAVLALVVLRAWLLPDAGSRGSEAAVALAYSFVGSLLVAAALAWVVGTVARRLDLRNESAVLLVLGLVLLAVSTARQLGLSTLLVPLLAGVMLRHTTERPWVWPRHFGTAGGVLVLMLFVIVGSSWSPAVLAAGGSAALLLVLVRAVAKAVGVLAFARPAGASARQGLALGIALTPVSATALVMLADLRLTSAPLAGAVEPIVLTAIALLELAGPLAVHGALSLAGELGPRPGPREGHAP